MSDTRTLLQKIQAFRQRLDALPRLVAEPVVVPVTAETTAEVRVESRIAAGSRTQAVLEQSIRHLNEEEPAAPPSTIQLTARARRVIAEAHELVGSLRTLADEPLLAGPPPGARTEDTDPLAIWFRETAAMLGPAVRLTQSLPDSAGEQLRLCEGLSGILETVRQRLAVLGGALEERRRDARQIDNLAHILLTIDSDHPIDESAVVELATEIGAEGPNHPIRFLFAAPNEAQAYLGGTCYAAPARFVACHSLTTARVMARMTRLSQEWKDDPLQPILAALLHDIGMLRVPVDVLGTTNALLDEQRRLVEPHPRTGADLIAQRLPAFAPIVASIAAHHERLDGTGYPSGLKGDQVPPLARLLSVADLYCALCCRRPYRDARDPRSALTDTLLYAEQNILDRFAAEKLLPMSFYPIGSVVELSDGAVGVVAANHVSRDDLHLAGRPVLNLLIDSHGGVMPSPTPVNLAETDTGSVIRTLSHEERARLLGRHYPQWAV